MATEFKLDYTGKEINDKLEMVGCLAEKYVTPQMFGAKCDGATDDTAVFQELCSIENNVVFLPSGEYLVGGKVTFAQNVTLYGENASIIATNDTTFVLNRQSKVNGISVVLPTGYDGYLFEVTNENLEFVNNDSLLNISVSDIEITCPLNYDNMANKEGTVFLIHAESEQSVSGYWGVTIKDIAFKGGIKYFCRNYCAADTWITNVIFDNITINTCKYGWFGGENEETIEVGVHKDVSSLFISNIYMQCNQSEAVGYFKNLEKILTNAIDYDWPVDKKKYLICSSATIGARTLSIDHLMRSIELDFCFPALEESVSNYYVRKFIHCDRVRYIGNRDLKDAADYRGDYHLFALTTADERTCYESTVSLKKTAIVRFRLTVYDNSQFHNITIVLLYAGGAWYSDVFCNTNFTDNCDIYYKVLDNDDSQHRTFTIKLIYKTAPSFTSAYLSYAFGDYSAELMFDRADDAIIGFTKAFVSSYGAFLPAVTTHYSPNKQKGCETNHMAQRSNTVVYKTNNGIEEHIPKIRKGTVLLSATEQSITFEDVATSDYIVMTNPPVSDLVVTNKTSTGFTVKSDSNSNTVMWVLIG